jgi:hypothetical protein
MIAKNGSKIKGGIMWYFSLPGPMSQRARSGMMKNDRQDIEKTEEKKYRSSVIGKLRKSLVTKGKV